MTTPWTERASETAPAELRRREPEPERFPAWWKLVVGCLVLTPLVAFLGDWFIAAESQGAAAVAQPPPPAPPSLLPPVETRVFVPGDLLSDLGEALAEGASSPRVHLETAEEEKAFERIQDAGSGQGGKGLTFFRKGKRRDGVEVFEARNAREEPQGLLFLERVDGRWHVVGVGAPGSGPAPGLEKEDASKGEADAALQSLLEHPDEEVRRAAAAALKEIQKR